MTIEFSDLPSNIRKPGTYTEEDTSNALRGVVSIPTKVLFIGQRLTSGTVTQNTPVRVYDSETAKGYFGAGSVLARMIQAGLSADSNLHLSAVAVDDASAGGQAEGGITFTGPATASGTLRVYVGNDLVEVAITSGDTATEIAAALVAATTTTRKPDLPLTTAVNGADDTKVDFTAKHKGTLGNDVPIEVYFDNATGVGAVVTDMSGGATDPTLTDTLTAIYGIQYHLIVCSLNDATSLGALKTHLEELAGPLEQRPGLGVYGHRGTVSTATTLAGTSINSGRMTGALLSSSRSLSYEIGAAYGAVIAAESDPAAPLDGRVLQGLAAPTLAYRLTRSEQETCLFNGVTPLEVDTSEQVTIVRAISTYVTNGSGTPDPTLLDITTLRTLDDFRFQWRARMSTVFGPSAPATNRKLTSKNFTKIRIETFGVMKTLEELERLRNVDDYKDQIEVEESTQAQGRVDVSIPAPVVPGLHLLAAKFNLIL